MATGFIRINSTTIRRWQAFGPEGRERVIDAIHTKRLGVARIRQVGGLGSLRREEHSEKQHFVASWKRVAVFVALQHM